MNVGVHYGKKITDAKKIYIVTITQRFYKYMIFMIKILFYIEKIVTKLNLLIAQMQRKGTKRGKRLFLRYLFMEKTS